MDLITTKEMTITLKCVCMNNEEFKKIQEYYRYIGLEIYEKNEGETYIRYFYIKKLKGQCINEHLDTRNIKSLPLYICETSE